jgi:hypothetical protein
MRAKLRRNHEMGWETHALIGSALFRVFPRLCCFQGDP